MNKMEEKKMAEVVKKPIKIKTIPKIATGI